MKVLTATLLSLLLVGAELEHARAITVQPLAGSLRDDVKDMDIEQLAKELYSEDESRRRAVVRQCVKLNTTDSWKIVVEALANEKGRPADEAQLQLAKLDDEKVLKLLWGKDGLKSKDPLIRTRVAELIGRREMGVDAEFLRKHLSDKDPEVRRLMMWSIERLAIAKRLLGEPEAELLKPLSKMAKKDRDGAVRGAALLAYGALGTPDEAMALANIVVEDRLAAARCGVAQIAPLLAGHSADGAFDLLRRLASAKEFSVRRAAVTGLGKLGTKPGVTLLITRLEAEQRPRIRWAIVDTLQRLSGMKYRLDIRPWMKWLDEIGDDWTPVIQEAEQGKADRGDATIAFSGLPILSDRVCFLIDLSGSIWTKQADGTIPKDIVGERLQFAIDRLSEDTLFNVIPYINDPVPWMEEVQKAKPKTREAAKEFFTDCRARGAGNVYGAIQLALLDPNVDTIIILTDGAPSGGHRWNLELMVNLLVEQNRFRCVTYDTLLVGASKFLTGSWEELAAATGGECTSIEL
jgi:hypothetical protein